MIGDLRKIIAAEYFKLRRRRSSWIIPLLVLAFSAAVFFALDFTVRRTFIGVPSGFYLASSTINWTSTIVQFVAVIAICFHISREFALGTVKSTWVRPLTRSSWYAGKIISGGAAVSVLFLLIVVVIVGLAGLRFGFTDLMEKDYLIHSAGSLSWSLILSLALYLWALWALVAVMALIAALVNHPGGAIAAGVGLGFLMTILAVFSELRPFLLSTYLSLPLNQMVAMSKGLPLPLEWGELVWRTLLGAGDWMAVSLLLGFQVIKRKEITF